MTTVKISRLPRLDYHEMWRKQVALDAMIAELETTKPQGEPTLAIVPAQQAMTRALLQQALEALEWEHGGEPLPTLTDAAIKAIRAELAKPPRS